MADTLLVGYVKQGSTQEELRRIGAGAVFPIRPCISCSRMVYVNDSGLRACREKDCEVVCELCEDRYDAELVRNL